MAGLALEPMRSRAALAGADIRVDMAYFVRTRFGQAHAGLEPSYVRHPSPIRVLRTAASRGVRGSVPSTAFKCLLSIRMGAFQRYRISDNSRNRGTRGDNNRMSIHGILPILMFGLPTALQIALIICLPSASQ
jgi:hypothetical protein